MYECPHCLKTFDLFVKRQGHIAQCPVYKLYLKQRLLDITKEELHSIYITQQLSRSETAKALSISEGALLKLFKIHGIEERSKQQQNSIRNKNMSLSKKNFTLEHNNEINKKREATVLVKYGVSNVFKSREIIEKMTKRRKTDIDSYGRNSYDRKTIKIRNKVLEKYGVTCVFKTDWVKEKSRNTLLRKYGVESSFQLSPIGYSKSSQEIFWKIYYQLPPELQQKCYFHELNHEFGKRCNITNKYYLYDFVISSIKFCIEFNGESYHPNKDKLSPEEWAKWRMLRGKENADEVYLRDQRKIQRLVDEGFRVIIIWWNDYVENFQKEVNQALEIIRETHLNYSK